MNGIIKTTDDLIKFHDGDTTTVREQRDEWWWNLKLVLERKYRAELLTEVIKNSNFQAKKFIADIK